MIYLIGWKNFYKKIKKGDIIVKLDGKTGGRDVVWKVILLNEKHLLVYFFTKNKDSFVFYPVGKSFGNISKCLSGYFYGAILNRNEQK